MANVIKGITVEIGGNTTKLGKSLDSTQKETRGLQVELRQVEKLLKFDPTNTELLIQKQNILADSVLATSKKLDTLKEAEAQVVAQFEKGDIGEEQLRAFQREIIQTEKTLNDMKADLSVATRNLNEFGDNNGVATEQSAKLEKELQDQKDALEAEKKALKEAEEAQKEHEKAVADAKEELKDFGDKAKDAFGKVKVGALAVGGAIVGAGGYALKVSTDFDKAFNTLITKTGASKDEMKGLEEAMENVYANNFGESIEDVAESMATVKTNTKLTGDELEKTTEYAILMRDTFDFDVNESTRSAKMLMDQFGISAKDAYNLIAQGAQSGLDKNGDLLDTINEYSVHFQQLGIDAPTMFNMLVNGAESGTFSVDKLGDAIKEFGIRTKDGSDSSRKAFEYLGYDADECFKTFNKGGKDAADMTQILIDELASMPDGVEKTTAGVALFGTMWEDLGAEGIKALSELDGGISMTKDALDTINEQKYDDIGSALQGLGRTLETDVVKPLGEELKPVVEDAIGYVQQNGPQITDILSKIVKFVGEFVGFIVDNGSTIISVLAGIGAGMMIWNVASMIHGVVSAIKAFQLANEGATVAQWAMNAAMNANPIGILVTIIGSIIIAIVTFIATNENARAKFIEIWNKIKETCSTAINAIVNFFTVTIPNAWNGFLAFCSNFITSIVNFFAKLPGRIWSFLANVVTRISTWGSNMYKSGVNAAKNTINAIINFFKTLPYKIGYAIGYVIGTLVKWGANMISWVKTNIPKIINNIVNFFKQLPGKIWTFLVNTVSKMVAWGSNMKAKATSTGKNVVTSVITFMRQLPGKVWSAIVGAVTRVATWGSQMKAKAVSAIKTLVSNVYSTARELPGKIWSAIVGAIAKLGQWGSQMLSKAKSAIKNVGSAIVNGLKSVPGKLGDVGKNIVEGLWKGISNATSWIKDKVKGFAKGILKGMKDALDIHSPSRKMEKEVGENIALGVIKGIDNKKANAKKTAKELSELYVETAKSKLDTLKQFNKVTEADEVAFWTKIKAHCKKGTSAYAEATLELYKAKSSLNENIKSLDSQYAEDVKSVKDKLKADIQELTDAYDKAIESRQNQITSSLNLFDAFAANDAIGKDDLTANLQSQVDALTEWDSILNQLSSRSGMDSTLLTELEGLGVSSLNTLKEISSMTDEELEQYVALFKQKNTIALERAKTENEALKKSSQEQINGLIEDANKSLNELEKTYNKNLKALGVTTKDTSISIGKDIINGLKSGIESQYASFQKYLTNLFSSINSSVKNAMTIDTSKLATLNSTSNNNVVSPTLTNTLIGSTLSASDIASNNAVLEKLDTIANKLGAKTEIVLDTGALVGATVDKMDSALANNQNLKLRGV